MYKHAIHKVGPGLTCHPNSSHMELHGITWNHTELYADVTRL